MPGDHFLLELNKLSIKRQRGGFFVQGRKFPEKDLVLIFQRELEVGRGGIIGFPAD